MEFRPENVGGLFASHVGKGHTAFTDLSKPETPRNVTFEEFDASCNAVARGLVSAGLGVGDRVAIMSGNRREFLESIFGAMRAGCVAVPINIKLADDTIQFLLNDADVRLAFVDRENEGRYPADQLRVNYDDQSYEDFLDRGGFEPVAPEQDTVAAQPYTAGSTGRPKGVLLTHAGIAWVSRAAVGMRKMDSSVRTLVAAPMYHKNALQAIKQSLTCGGCMTILRQFEARRYIEAIGQYECTLLTGVPTMFALLLRERDLLEETDLSSVTRIGFGSAPGSDALYDRLQESFPNATVENVYGVTEGGPIMFGPHPRRLERPRNSIGCVMEGAEVELVGGVDGDQGVLHVRSPGVMLGYHNLPLETDAALNDGWFDSGDVLRRDSEGFFYLVGRSDDMFVCAGENIYPGEVETLLERNGNVLQAVVVPVDDELKGKLPHAFVVRRPDSGISEEEIKKFALENGPAYAHPRRVHIVSELPLTGAGKIDRSRLKTRAENEKTR